MLELPAPSIIFAAILFGCIGTAAFLYGRKRGRYKLMGLGAALCIYPYLTGDSVLLVWVVGILLTGAMYFFND